MRSLENFKKRLLLASTVFCVSAEAGGAAGYACAWRQAPAGRHYAGGLPG